ncbi:hypothetical protein BGZ58_004047 [Dissophora ornata]|nr:hypothetical protein BGZ58_004047 [Dissophora ornata]
MEDELMETSPVSSASNPGPLNTVQLTELSAENANIRFSLGHSIVQDFAIYRDILDEHHERRERIIKVSRDINNFSKKMIFALHRAEPKDYLPQFSATSEALIEFREKHAIVLKLLHRASVDLQGSNYHRYQRSISGAMQEYIEAMTLEYYLIHGKLMPKSALEADLVFMTTPEQLSNQDLIIGIGQTQLGGGGSGPRGKFNKDNRRVPYNKDKRETAKKSGSQTPAELAPIDALSSAILPTPMAIEVDQSPTLDLFTTAPTETLTAPDPRLTRLTLDITDEDYLLGVADLTGELMRLAINTLGQSLTSLPARDLDSIGGTLLPTPEERVQNILLFLRDLKSGFDGLAHTKVSPVWKKMGAFKQSLNKIEMACYNVKVRGAEYPPEILRQMLMSGSDIGGGSGGSAGGDAGNDEEE